MKFIASTYPLSSEGICYILPDTALRQGGQPFFIPEGCGSCVGVLRLAVRVCRQGRSIDGRFAHRYYDAVTCAVHFVQRDTLARVRAAGLPWCEALGFDGAVCVGAWADVPLTFSVGMEFPETFELRLRVGQDGAPMTSVITARLIDNFIAEASSHFTLHQGDILLPDVVHPTDSSLTGESPTFEAATDVRVFGELDGNPVLSFKIK